MGISRQAASNVFRVLRNRVLIERSTSTMAFFVASCIFMVLLFVGPAAAFGPMPQPLPSEGQLFVQELGLSQFMHFSVNPFSKHTQHNCVNGTGVDAPPCLPAALFNPTNLSTDQWVETAVAFGAKEICLTAHHYFPPTARHHRVIPIFGVSPYDYLLWAAGTLHVELVNLRAEVFPGIKLLRIESRPFSDMLLAPATPDVVRHLEADHTELLPLIAALRPLVAVAADLLRVPVRWVVEVVRPRGSQ